MNIVLLSCTKSKKDYTCPASEMYSESALFRKAYEYAKLISDKIYILSAKYGLLEEDTIIEPYELTLNNQKIAYRKEWAKRVLSSLEKRVDLINDNFTILTGHRYYEFLIGSLAKYDIPLLGKSMGYWIPMLQELIDKEEIRVDADTLHELFSYMPRYNYSNIRDVPFTNGIYIMFGKDEEHGKHDRIVRVGTHREQGNLKTRLTSHFSRHNQRSSIFRRNIGRIIIAEKFPDYYPIWNAKKDDRIDKVFEKSIELEISDYIKNNITFTVFKVEDKNLRLRIEDGIISTLNHDPTFNAPDSWLGNNSPICGIKNSGLWCVNGLNAEPLSQHEFMILKKCVAGDYAQNDVINGSKKRNVQTTTTSIKQRNTTSKPLSKTEMIKQYICNEVNQAKVDGKTFLDLVSGEVHSTLNLRNSMPLVCNAMYGVKVYRYDILHQTPSGMSSTIKIRYYID